MKHSITNLSLSFLQKDFVSLFLLFCSSCCCYDKGTDKCRPSHGIYHIRENFVGEKYLSLDQNFITAPLKLSVEIYCRGKLFITWANFCHFSPTKFSQIKYLECMQKNSQNLTSPPPNVVVENNRNDVIWTIDVTLNGHIEKPFSPLNCVCIYYKNSPLRNKLKFTLLTFVYQFSWAHCKI